MKIFIRFFSALMAVAMPFLAQANDTGWPRTIKIDNGHITLYQPQPEALHGDMLSARATISITIDNQEPVFGAIWGDAVLTTGHHTRTAAVENITITNVKFPDINGLSKIEELKHILETEIPKLDIGISLDRILTSLNEAEANTGNVLNMAPPKIIYVEEPTLLVVIDGEPKLQQDKELRMQRVVNTPFVILQSSDKNFYLYVSGKWFKASSIDGQWAYTRKPPQDIETAGKAIDKADEFEGDSKFFSNVIPMIMVCTAPTELIQSNGTAEFSPVQNTSLRYVSNSEDDIFINMADQYYYILLSGRWYASQSLTGDWTHIAGEKLPPDFKKIPEGSQKDIVLASIPGTNAAKEAVADAQVPKTAKVDRKKASTVVKYDGAPVFEDIPGTNLQYAVNTLSVVLREDKAYYTVDKAVWLEAGTPDGPWKAATTRPEDVDKIPADNPAYNVKYVYIYDITPDYIYMGYTPGYLACYADGDGVFYGTGFYYQPWFGAVYYPRPVTWGFSMHYNPSIGWCTGIGANVGCFHFGFNSHGGGGFPGGWWGTPVYHPPFYYPYSHYYGPIRPVAVPLHNNLVINNYANINHSTNIYNHRTDVTPNNTSRTSTRK